MTRSSPMQHRIGEINYYHFNISPGLGDNFSIRLAHKLAEAGDLDLAKIKKVVNEIETTFFKSHQSGGKNINRNEYARVLYDDLKRCELLKAPAEIPQNEQVLRVALFEIMETTRLAQAKAIARKALRQATAYGEKE